MSRNKIGLQKAIKEIKAERNFGKMLEYQEIDSLILN